MESKSTLPFERKESTSGPKRRSNIKPGSIHYTDDSGGTKGPPSDD